MTKNRNRTIIVALIFLIIAGFTGYKHLREKSGFTIDKEGNITNVNAKKYNGDVIVPSEIDGVTVKTVSLDGVKGIKSIELDQAKSLECIKLNNIKIAKLDTTKNKELKQLWIKGTKIKRLDIRNNQALLNLGCEGNKLETLDVTGNPKLKYIDCTNNKIKYLNIQANSALKTVYVDPDVVVTGDNSVVQRFDPDNFMKDKK